MVICHAHGLHERIANGRSAKFESCFFERLRHGAALLCFSWNILLLFESILFGAMACVLPQEISE